MKVFVALMLVAAASATFVPTTNTFDKTIVDYLRTQRRTNTNLGAIENVFPFGTHFNVPSDVTTDTTGYTTYYTLAQLYSHPLFQQYTAYPLFQYHLTYPAFQRFVESAYFQKYWTFPEFQQLFKDAALFYKYIYPVVATKFQTYGLFDKVIVVPEVYRQYVPEYVNYFVQQQYGQDYFNTVYGDYATTHFNKFGRQTYNRNPIKNLETPEFWNYYGNYLNGNKYNFNKKPVVVVDPYTVFNKNALNKQDTTAVNTGFVVPTMDDIRGLLTGLFTEGVTEYLKTGPINGANGATFTFNGKNIDLDASKILNLFTAAISAISDFKFVPATDERPYSYFGGKLPFETVQKLYKDHFGYSLDATDADKAPVVQDTIKNVVDPVTGTVKVIEEKVVEPITTGDVIIGGYQGDLVKDPVLRKVILKKELYNKV